MPWTIPIDVWMHHIIPFCDDDKARRLILLRAVHPSFQRCIDDIVQKMMQKVFNNEPFAQRDRETQDTACAREIAVDWVVLACLSKATALHKVGAVPLTDAKFHSEMLNFTYTMTTKTFGKCATRGSGSGFEHLEILMKNTGWMAQHDALYIEMVPIIQVRDKWIERFLQRLCAALPFYRNANDYIRSRLKCTLTHAIYNTYHYDLRKELKDDPDLWATYEARFGMEE